jgi:redox-sensitive bicupin YhaK (pirin superfamily)
MIDLVIEQRRRDLGGFEVGRVLPWARRRMVGPFVFFDHIGPVEFPAGMPRSLDVRPHPHIGLSTVTYLFDGEIMHRDSVGSAQSIRPGEVNWMTAGSGITHSERFERARQVGGNMHGIQAWVALPKEDEETDPAFAHYGAGELPVMDEPGCWMRLVAGQAYGMKSSVKTHSPMFYLHCEVSAGGHVALPDEYTDRAAYVAKGSVQVDGHSYGAGNMIVFRSNEPVSFSVDEDATVMLLGGESLGERYIDWNFVSSSQDRIAQAKADWRAGRMKLPDLDNEEFIPLPPEKAAPANPMS